MRINNFFKLVIAVAVSESAGIIGSVFTMSSVAGWYAGIVKPEFNPPAWVFGPVWTALYALMGISLFLFLRPAGLEHAVVNYLFWLDFAHHKRPEQYRNCVD